MYYLHINEQLKKALGTNELIAYNQESAGIDLYYAGDKRIILDPVAEWDCCGSKTTNPSNQLIPTGMRIDLGPEEVALLRERGSVIKTPLVLRAGVIDPGYTGEIFVNLVNVGANPWIIEPYSKLPVQLIVLPFNTKQFRLVDEESFEAQTKGAYRQAGKVGSSDGGE